MGKPPVVILCGGRGTRLRERTESVPKALVEIGGKPILWHVIQIYAAQGFERFLLATGYMGEAVAEFAASVGRIVTAENHVVVGGLASLVVETLFDAGIAKTVTRIGLPDRYIECGAVPTLQAKYGLTTEAVIATIAALG